VDTKSRYGLALGLLLFAYLIGGIQGKGIDLLVALIFVGLLTVLVFDREARAWVKAVGILLIVASVASSVVAYVADAPQVGQSVVGGVSSIFDALVMFWAIVIVLHRIIRHREITLSTVMGGVLAYTLIGFLFASVYLAINYFTGCSPDGVCGFFAQPDANRGDFQYFSFVVLTTLGFGDLTAGTDFGQRVVVIEALMGQVFLVVFVARMVSLWGTTARMGPPETKTVQDT